MPSRELVEAVAKAIYEARNGPGCIAWEHREGAHKRPYRKDAEVAIAAVYEALKEPTSEMVAAWITPSPKMRPVSVSEQLIAGATRDWTAMLGASPLAMKVSGADSQPQCKAFEEARADA